MLIVFFIFKKIDNISKLVVDSRFKPPQQGRDKGREATEAWNSGDKFRNIKNSSENHQFGYIVMNLEV